MLVRNNRTVTDLEVNELRDNLIWDSDINFLHHEEKKMWLVGCRGKSRSLVMYVGM